MLLQWIELEVLFFLCFFRLPIIICSHYATSYNRHYYHHHYQAINGQRDRPVDGRDREG